MPNFGPSIAPVLASLIRDEAIADAGHRRAVRRAVRRARDVRRQSAAEATRHHRSVGSHLAVLGVWVAVLALFGGWVATAYVEGHV